jgi:hypothetical protein
MTSPIQLRSTNPYLNRSYCHTVVAVRITASLHIDKVNLIVTYIVLRLSNNLVVT